VERLNHLLIGWANYFCLGRVRSAYRTVNYHAVKRLRQWFCCKHKVRGRRDSHASPTRPCTKSMGWCTLSGLFAIVCGRTHEALSESRMQEICTSGLMSGVWKRSRVGLVGHRQPKGSVTDRSYLHHRATSRLYPLV
jgi:hypothetical protein